MLLADVLANIERNKILHDALSQKPLQDLSFDETIKLVQLKIALAKDYLQAAKLSPGDNNAAVRGDYLRAAIKYNTYVAPSLLVRPKNKLPDFKGMISSSTAIELQTAAMLPVIITVAMASPLEVVFNLFAKPAVAGYVHLNCLEDIPESVTSEVALSTAVAYLNEGRNYLAMRYLLEAAIRSPQNNPNTSEIIYYIGKCFKNLITPSGGVVVAAQRTDMGRELDISTVWSNIYTIKQKVLAGKAIPNHQNLGFIWNLDNPFMKSTEEVNIFAENFELLNYGFYYQICGFNTSTDTTQVTLPEIARQMIIKLHVAEPDQFEYSQGNSAEAIQQASSALPLSHLAALMCEVVADPESGALPSEMTTIAKIAINNSRDAERSTEIEKHLLAKCSIKDAAPKNMELKSFSNPSSNNNNNGNDKGNNKTASKSSQVRQY